MLLTKIQEQNQEFWWKWLRPGSLLLYLGKVSSILLSSKFRHCPRRIDEWELIDYSHPDPFYTAIQLLPSDKAALLRKQQRAQDILSPHLRILQFFESHFNAIRLASPHLQRIFTRAINRTLIALQHTQGHPLSREVHFHIVLLGLRILQYSTTQSRIFKWKLKDLILSAALSWFRHPPRFVSIQIFFTFYESQKLIENLFKVVIRRQSTPAESRG